MTKQITFDKFAARDVLEIFGKTLDEEGYVVEKDNPKQRVLTQEGEEVKLEEFAGISKGSEIFIKSDFVSLFNFAKKKKD